MTDTWKLPGYIIEAQVGRGGAADVWRARAARSGDVVALKRVRVTDAAQLASVRAEAAVLAALDHPNLVRVHEIVQTKDAAVLVLDYAARGSLADLIRSRGRLAPGEVISALAPVGAALACAHDASVVHGDVSAANVLFTEAGHALLSDLGVARLLGDRGPAFGTPAYVDPSVAAGAPPGPESDVFMLAGVALHALTGLPTWPDASADEALARARSADVDEAIERLMAAEVPEPMQAVLRRALSPDPRRRGTAAEFALDLRHSGRPIAVELNVRQRAGSERSRSPRHALPPPTRLVAPRARPVLPRTPPPGVRRRRAAVMAAAATVVCGGLAVLLWSPWRTAEQAAAITPVDVPSRAAQPTHSAAAASSGWVAALDSLDARRAQAYARRAPQLLDDVYADATLRSADRTTLAHLVPPGCGLVNVRTSYTAVQQLQASSTHAVLVVTAKLADARLVCAGHTRSSTPPSAATRLRIELTRSAHGVQIARQQVVPAGQSVASASARAPVQTRPPRAAPSS